MRTAPARATSTPLRLTCTAILAAVALLAGMLPAAAITPAPDDLPQTPRVDITPQIVKLTFPVAQPESQVTYPDTFLAERGGGSRLHAATDIMAPKHRPVHAAVGGTIRYAPHGPEEPDSGWMLDITGDDGRRYVYVHLNNDTPEKDAAGNWLDDDAGGIEHAYAPRIVDAIRSEGTAHGLRVERGELIGWVGDSGNAKGVEPHLHFEIHVEDAQGEEYRINPHHSLVAAVERGDVPGATPAVEMVGGYLDVTEDGVHTPAILRLTDEQVVTGCQDDRYCPHDPLTRGDLARFLAAALGIDPGGTPRFDDVDQDDPNAPAIAAVTEEGILNGYDAERFGPQDPFSREQLATVLVQGFELPPAADDVPFDDVLSTNVHAANIAAAFEAGLTQGCEDGSRYCGARPVTRGQIASLLVGALDATS